MSTLFQEFGEAAEPTQEPHVTVATRFLYCAWAGAVGLIPALGTAYAASQVTELFRSFTDAASIKAPRILLELHDFNTPLIVALGVAAFLAFALTAALAMDPNRRLAAVGLPFSIAIPILAATPAVLLWFAETPAIAFLSGKQIGTANEIAETISRSLFWALASALVVQGVIVVWAIISVCIPARKRKHALSISRVIPWAITGILLLVLAGAYFVMI